MIAATQTPDFLAEQMADMINIQPNDKVLEPSAGYGSLAKVARSRGASVTCIELNAECVKHLKTLGFLPLKKDFLKVPSERKFDAVMMCPPMAAFSHVAHALNFLKPKGRLIALVHENFKMIDSIRSIASGKVEWHPLPSDMFHFNNNTILCGMMKIHHG